MADYGKGPSKEDWAKSNELLNTGFRGFDMFQRLPVVLKTHIPWMRDWTIGFSTVEDMDTFTSRGWRPVSTEHFGKDGLTNFNNTIGLRFNLSSVDGVVRYKGHILMMKPNEYREEQVKIQNESFEDYYSKISQQAYVHPKDPRGDEMAKGSYAKLDEEVHHRAPAKAGNLDD
jgi:hypothetical protein